jgi:DNA-binding XRE family transcriptional regulator
MSQRELAATAGVSRAAIGKAEAGMLVPSLAIFARILEAAGLWLAVVDGDGHVVQPMEDWQDTRDRG